MENTQRLMRLILKLHYHLCIQNNLMVRLIADDHGEIDERSHHAVRKELLPC
jgi:hypothetical protein